MYRRPLTLMCGLLMALVVAGPARTQEPKAAPVNIKITVPHIKTELTIQGQPTRQGGVQREFVSPPLDPGRDYEYTMVAKWAPNNYTTLTRTKMVKVKAGQTLEIDFNKKDEGKEDDILVRYVPTPPEIVEEMCKLAKITKDDVVYDLGCGDGRMVIAAVKKFNAKKGVGVDIDPARVADSKENVKREKVEDKVEIRQGDVLKIDDLPDATVILLYMGDDLNNALKPILLKTLKPGARIVSHRFKMGDWKPEKTITVKDNESEEYQLHLWTIGEKKDEKKPE